MTRFAELRRRSSPHEAGDIRWIGKSAQSCVVMFALFDDLSVKRTGRWRRVWRLFVLFAAVAKAGHFLPPRSEISVPKGGGSGGGGGGGGGSGRSAVIGRARPTPFERRSAGCSGREPVEPQALEALLGTVHHRSQLVDARRVLQQRLHDQLNALCPGLSAPAGHGRALKLESPTGQAVLACAAAFAGRAPS